MPFYFDTGKRTQNEGAGLEMIKEYLQTGDDNDRKAGGSCIMMEFRFCAVLSRS